MASEGSPLPLLPVSIRPAKPSLACISDSHRATRRPNDPKPPVTRKLLEASKVP